MTKAVPENETKYLPQRVNYLHKQILFVKEQITSINLRLRDKVLISEGVVAIVKFT